MKRRFMAIVLVAAGVILVSPAPEASALHEECFDDPVAGAVVQEGYPTTAPPSHYKVTTTGFEVTIGPVPGVGEFHVEVNTNEVSVYARSPLGLSLLTVQAGADVSPGTTDGTEWEYEACLVTGAVQGHTYNVDVDDPDPARPGVVVRVLECTGGDTWNCEPLLGHTGAEISLGTPLSSCLWIDGREQNVAVTCPSTDPGSGLPLSL